MELQITYPIEFIQEVATLLGVSSEDITEDEILSLPFAGSAELELIKLVPTAKSILEDPTTDYSIQLKLTLAYINLIAYYIYPALKTKLLYSESDNKTIGTRFKDALSRDRNEFKAEAIKQIEATGVATSIASYSLLEIVAPEIDIITGIA